MKRMVFVTALGIFVTTGLCADTAPPGTTEKSAPLEPVMGPASEQWFSATMARLNKKGEVVLKSLVTRYVPLTATRVIRDGKEVEEKHTIYDPVTRWEDKVYDPKEIKLLGSDGKPLDKKMLPELLKKERPVLFLYSGMVPDDKIDSTLFKVIKEGTPILVLPAPAPILGGPS